MRCWAASMREAVVVCLRLQVVCCELEVKAAINRKKKAEFSSCVCSLLGDAGLEMEVKSLGLFPVFQNSVFALVGLPGSQMWADAVWDHVCPAVQPSTVSLSAEPGKHTHTALFFCHCEDFHRQNVISQPKQPTRTHTH